MLDQEVRTAVRQTAEEATNGALAALASPWGGSAWVMKFMVIVLLAAATAGMARRLTSVGAVPALGAGLLYAFGPYLMGRLAVGHLGVLWAAAIIPWALPALISSARSPARWDCFR